MGTSASFARKALSCLAAALLAFTLVPAGAFAGQESTEPSGVEESEGAFGSEAPDSPQPPSDPSSEADSAVSDGTSAEAGTLAASLMGRPVSFVNADVALGGEPIIGSFTVDGLTFAVTEGSNVELVGVSGLEVAGSTRAASEAEAEGSASEAAASIVALPESVAYDDAEYAVISIGAYAFYLSGVTSVELPASVIDVDDRAFRSSDVASVEVAAGNPTYSSFDGALYSADQSSLLLIPEGKQGAVLLPKETEVAEAGKFSHCSLVDAISAEDGAAFASENGLLYDASLTTLLRVPAGATDITIREGCTTITAGAMEGCAKLAAINAPASVTSISPDVFISVPTVSLPVASLAEDAPQLTAMVALSSTEDVFPSVTSSSITVVVAQKPDEQLWQDRGFLVCQKDAENLDPVASSHAREGKAAASTYTITFWTAWVDGVNNPTVITATGSGWTAYANGQFHYWDGSQLKSVAAQRPAGYPATSYCVGWTVGGRAWVTDDPSVPGAMKSYTGTTDINVIAAWSDFGSRVEYHLNGGIQNYWNYWLKSNSEAFELLPPTRVGYAFDGWYADSALRDGPYTLLPAAGYDCTRHVYARWTANPYTIAFDSQGGPAVASISATYDQDVTLPVPGARNGYRFAGWNTQADGSGTTYNAGVSLTKPNLATAGTTKLYAQWDAVISALVPLDVEAQVDVLGLEAPKEATGYIESRCGEPLKVESVKFTPLDGAADLFGAGNVADVFLEVLANNGISPNARFSLGSSATESDATKLSAFTMSSYGTRVSIGYRFVMAPEVQTSLVESSTAKPVCSVAYTVARA